MKNAHKRILFSENNCDIYSFAQSLLYCDMPLLLILWCHLGKYHGAYNEQSAISSTKKTAHQQKIKWGNMMCDFTYK